MEQPCRALVAAGVAAAVSTKLPVVFGEGGGTSRRVVRLRTDASTLVFQRPLADRTRECVEIAAGEGRTVWVELDDDCWSLPAHDPASRQITPAMIANLTAACRAATGVIVSTPALAHRLTRQTGQRNVVVIPNAIDPAAMPPQPVLPPDAPLIVGWAGSLSHARDMAVALPALRAVAALPAVRLSIQGEDLLAGTGIPHRHAPWTPDVALHYRRVALLRVAIAPLLPSAFNASKSPVKWLEHAYSGCPMVLSRVGPYAAAVRDGETGLLAEGVAGFRRQLLRLVNDAALREEIGEAAREEVLARHLIAHRVPLYLEVFGLSAQKVA